MVLCLVGLGLDNIENLTIAGCSLITTCSKLYFIASKFHPYNKNVLEEYLGQEVFNVISDEFKEKLPQIILQCQNEGERTSFLMPGNPFCDNLYPLIAFHCHKLNVSIEIIHNMSYMNAMGNTGIQLYKFGEAILMDGCSGDDFDSYLNVINSNMEKLLNTLVIFNKETDVNLASQLITSVATVKNIENSAMASSKIVFLYKKDNHLIFDYCCASEFKSVAPRNIEALAVCCEFDCVEEEYLREMKRYQSGIRKGFEGSGNFNIIGLGLGSPKDITLKGKKLIESSGKVFLESYTSIMLGGKEELETFFKKDIIIADRELVEQKSDEVLGFLDKGIDVSLLVVGDPFGATTHTDIILRALEKANDVTISNNASIMNVIGLSGLKPCRFGGTISIPFWTENYKPDSFYDKIKSNCQMGWHTLCLLDIQVKEQSFENLAKGRKIYEKPRYMSVSVAAKQLIDSKDRKARILDENQAEECAVGEKAQTVCLARIGTQTENVVSMSLGDLPEMDLGPPLHSLIIVGKLDEEEENLYKLKT